MSTVDRVTFTDGVFDLLHANHIALLEEASTFGDRLVVGVISDAVAQEYKRCPVICESERLRIVLALSCVDEAFIMLGPLVGRTMEKIISAYRISAVVYAGTNTPEFYLPAERANMMHRLPYHSGVNSSRIVRRIISRHQAGELFED